MKPKFFVFSDESGSWHDNSDIYVRSWIVCSESTHNTTIVNKVDEIAAFFGSEEIKWSNVSGGALDSFIEMVKQIDFRVYVTITSPGSIDWENKYNILKNYESSISNFDFGSIDLDLKNYIVVRMERDIKNALFLHYYERLHIDNAQKAISQVITLTDYELIYRIDPPQLPRSDWQSLLVQSVGSNTNFEFASSKRSQGIQFADVIAGAFRSFFLTDPKYDKARLLLKHVRPKMINMRSRNNPNPNLIMFPEMEKFLDKCNELRGL